MSAPSNRAGRRNRVQAMTERAPVTTLELFFDLVFVFALTRITDLMPRTRVRAGSPGAC